jgi:predicted Zn-dependent peptidase
MRRKMMNNTASNIHSSSLLCESYYTHTHASGLSIYIFPKKLTTTYAIVGVKYGSANNSFFHNGSKISVPDGIAHFLEHKLFTNED